MLQCLLFPPCHLNSAGIYRQNYPASRFARPLVHHPGSLTIGPTVTCAPLPKKCPSFPACAKEAQACLSLSHEHTPAPYYRYRQPLSDFRLAALTQIDYIFPPALPFLFFSFCLGVRRLPTPFFSTFLLPSHFDYFLFFSPPTTPPRHRQA